ncbi:NAD(P)H-hydrate dehydratase [Acinetobacter silvestris]|uniref:ADP-dependent (S)-NAD(P)H-hydrate dehydratase n=1 Tax=Acinetobacter silvestris TaxID=1977882 RepID=A0A1Y3CKK0_9GAMM|nr:NAD(P)H-hydrate dehydratase [Acinetobacter silvestris]OTG66400.1 bifunctional ADP-dependent NAD(P)H-hydrate dehydratase/NAD(P)H-hydrate epimerase [Acinetobacter silvestris]
MHQQVYHSRDIQAWEQRWFSEQNSAYGLMQQVAWSIAQRLDRLFKSEFQLKSSSHISKIRIAVWCGAGNNAGDGYCIASYLKQCGYQVEIFASAIGHSTVLKRAVEYAQQNEVLIHQNFNMTQSFDCQIDALFGIGLNRDLNEIWQAIIQNYNHQSGLKISIDLPSGLNANTGQPLPCAIRADRTFTILGLKAGLFTGQGKEYSGQVDVVSLIPKDQKLKPIAQLSSTQIQLPQRQAFGHKGSYGHVLVVGGHADMGGAVMMSAESAFSAGAGKVTIVCHAKHHTAILARSPNIMIRDINALNSMDIQALLGQVDAVCFGMGLGRDTWSEQQFFKWFPQVNASERLEVVLDADALWFLALNPIQLRSNVYATPHPGEAAKLLNCTVKDIESDRIDAVQQLQQKYAGQWVLKGAGSLILQDELWICTAGNAGMGTGGMGDVLAGMIASLKAQLHNIIQLHEIVTLHALAGDYLAEKGLWGLQAQHMNEAVYYVVNHTVEQDYLG